VLKYEVFRYNIVAAYPVFVYVVSRASLHASILKLATRFLDQSWTIAWMLQYILMSGSRAVDWNL